MDEISKNQESVKDSTVGSSLPSEQNSDANSNENVAEVENDSEKETEQPSSDGKSRKKLSSNAWEYFDLVTVEGKEVAKCRCKKHFSYKGQNGTSNLNKHYKNTCPKRHLNITGTAAQTQLKVKKEDGKPPTLLFNVKKKKVVFDQEVSRRELVKMVVIHEYPLSIVDHMGFRSFVKSLNDEFKMISRKTLRNDVLKMYNVEKASLKVLLEHNKGRVAITTDMWTASNQKKGYMAITAHFIDEEWNLHNRTLRFCFVPCPHTKSVIAKILMDCFSQYALENKISSVVVDNCTTNDAMINLLLEKLERSCLVLGGEFLHMRCSAHILNLIVKDGLEVIEDAISNVRDCVAFWMSTPKRLEKFEEACRLLNITKSKRVGLDCKTRWNSTFLMIESCLPFKEVFSKLKRLNRRLKFVVPSDDDWTMATLVCQKLEIFYKATKIFSTRKHPTANLFFRIVCEIRLSLRHWVENDTNLIIREMAKTMVEKFDKYWSHINGILAIATILDPRNKMDCVAHYFKKIYKEDADRELSRVRKILDSLFLEYQAKSNVVDDQSLVFTGFSEHNDDEDDFARAKRQKIRAVPVRSEVDQYLESDTLPENADFDVLNWWKRDQMYPTLQKIAKDILAIPVSSVASESAFSMGGRVISAHRSRLHSQTVEALMCLQNWMIDDIKDSFEEPLACATCDEDREDDAEVIDIIDMDVDDVSSGED